MNIWQYKILGFFFFLLTLATTIAYFGMRSDAQRGEGTPPSMWLLAIAVGFALIGIWCLRVQLSDPDTLSDTEMLNAVFKSSRQSFILILLPCGGLSYALFGTIFLGWDHTINNTLRWSLSPLFLICLFLSIKCVIGIYTTLGSKKTEVINRLTQRTKEITKIERWLSQTENIKASAHLAVMIHFVDGTHYHFQMRPNLGNRLIETLVKRSPHIELPSVQKIDVGA